MSNANPGDTFKVYLDGVEYETVIDDRGVQRFKTNPEHFLLKSAPKIWVTNRTYKLLKSKPPEGHPDADGCWDVDLNELCIMYQRGKFSQRDYAEMNMANGYSVCGFNDISSFHDMRLVNECWGEDVNDPMEGITDQYLGANFEKKVFTLSQVKDIIMHRDEVSDNIDKIMDEWVRDYV